VKELRLAGLSTPEAANAWLPGFTRRANHGRSRCLTNRSPRSQHRHCISAGQGWRHHEALGDKSMTIAAIDRLVHHATILEMNVESYRRRAATTRRRPKSAPHGNIAGDSSAAQEENATAP
jgi:IstB-like ATP binding protein